MTISRAHIGKTCPYCQFPLKGESNIIKCSTCVTPHHLECWQENHGCSTFGCLSELYYEERSTDVDFHQQFLDGTAPILPEQLRPGLILQERYQLGKAIGQGNYGITYLALDNNLEMKVVVKEYFPRNLVNRIPGNSEVMLTKPDMDNDFKYGYECFSVEAKALAHLPVQPNIVTVKDYFQTNGTAYMVMNYLEGSSLEQYFIENGNQLTFNQLLFILLPVCEALSELHKEELFHLAINPDCIVINSAKKAVLTDFGEARYDFHNKLGNLTAAINPGYTPLEQYFSQVKKGPWIDIYALAATIYRGISGHQPPEPFERLNEENLLIPSALQINLDHNHESALTRALAIKAADRYRTVEEFLNDLKPSSGLQKRDLNYTENVSGFLGSTANNDFTSIWESFRKWLVDPNIEKDRSEN